MKLAPRLALGLLLGASAWTSCRQVSVCDAEADCATTSPAAASGASSSASGDGGAPSAAGNAGGSDGAGEATAGAGGAMHTAAGEAGSSTGGAALDGPSCPSGTDECDESSLTVCETPTSYSFRHCGTCGARCGGICSVGRCKPPQELFGKGTQHFVANASAAFALVSAPNEREILHRFDLDSGEDTVLTDELEEGAELLLGLNRIYLQYWDRVVSVGLDGSGATTEAFSPESFGVTSAGVYYTSYVTNPQTEVDTWTLWFKPAAATKFTALSKGKECDILGSSSQAVLVRRETADGAEILLARGAELTSLGDSPGEPLAALPAADRAVFLLANDAVPTGYELVWLQAEEPPAHEALEAEPEDFNLVPAPDGVALLLEERNNSFVRIFSPSGTEGVRLGIPLNTTLAHVDERYVWYSWFGAPDLSQHFQRARQFEPNDLLPLQ